jgi:two-component system KDP operon response regulator KdpE
VVAQIRNKLGDDPANPKYIVNEPGVGYRLEA